LVGIIEGIPAGLSLTAEYINHQLRRRQQGHGRGGRMKIEQDHAEIVAGVRHGKTLGSPVALLIWNRDWENWKDVMAVEEVPEALKRRKRVTVPRPGHADLTGMSKYGFDDIRNVIERASARETATRVALSAVARRLLEEFGVVIASHVVQIGSVRACPLAFEKLSQLAQLNDKADGSPVRCLDASAEQKMIALIDEAKSKGDTLGGIFEVIAAGLPVGLGSYVHWDRKLDGRLAQAILSINAVKGVEIGPGFENATRFGSEVQDEIVFDEAGEPFPFERPTNRGGGLEGGMTNGEPIILRGAMKPLSTLIKPKKSVDVETKQQVLAHVERSDVCAVPACSVIGEAMVALVLADAFLEKFGGDSVEEVRKHFQSAVVRGGSI